MATRAKRRGKRVPSYRLHKASGNGIVTLSGKDHYLGPHRTPASQKRYRDLLSQWLANEKRPLPSPKGNAANEVDDKLHAATHSASFTYVIASRSREEVVGSAATSAPPIEG